MASCNRFKTLIFTRNILSQNSLKSKQCRTILQIAKSNDFLYPSQVIDYNLFCSTSIHRNKNNDVTEVKNNEIQTETRGQKAKENAKTASYGMVIVKILLAKRA